MIAFFYFLKIVFEVWILFFAITVMSSYIMLAVYSYKELSYYLKKNSFVDYDCILRSTLAPSVSMIAPAYNESMTIVENIRSMLTLYYANFEVVVVNDGSKDDSLQKLIDAYELQPVDFYIDYKIKSKPIRNVYKSVNPAFYKLTVVDKENGGKADALNAGMNIARNDLFLATDVDCIIEEDAILKMVKPFIEETEKRVIATGGVVRIANSCVISMGRIVEVKFPTNFWARFQVMEYIRAFLLGRMAWAHLDGLMLISGAFGMFDKEIALLAGGYDTKTVGEDMELVVRMRSYMHEHDLKYTVAFIPDPLCWTEAPQTLKVLGRQRTRWTRGTIETLLAHKKVFFNPNYGLMGMLSYPYWFFFEWLAPLLEFIGITFTLVMVLIGQVYWMFFLTLLAAVYCYALFFSSLAIFAEENSYHQYTKESEIRKVILTSVLEPFLFHPLSVYWSVKGNIEKVRGKKSWGNMTRVGFATNTKPKK